MSKSQAEYISDLLQAAEDGDLAQLKKCLARVRGGVNAADDEGFTALHQAAQEGHADIVQYLLDNGADIDLTDNDGATARDLAENNDHQDVVELLENRALLKDIVEWSLLGSSKLVHIEASLVLDRKLVEIFNFESRERLTYIEKLKTGSEPIVPMPSAGFDDLPEETLRNVFQKFTQLGGKADESFVLRAKTRLKKLPLKPE
jgi:hypothetical protein